MLPDQWFTVDPGNDTGWTYNEGDVMVDSGTDKLWDFIDRLSAEAKAGVFTGTVVVEDWKIYPWKAKDLAWDPCRTARGIGAITLICREWGLPLVFQPASIKEVAKAGGAEMSFAHPLHENRHMNDAIMHRVFYIASQSPQAQRKRTAVTTEDSGSGGPPE